MKSNSCLESFRFEFRRFKNTLLIKNINTGLGLTISDLKDWGIKHWILPSITENDLIWFEELLKTIHEVGASSISFQGLVLCQKAYYMIKSFQQSLLKELKLSFSVSVAMSTELFDNELIYKMDCSFLDLEFVILNSYNTIALEYQKLKEIIPNAYRIAEEIEQKALTELQKNNYGR